MKERRLAQLLLLLGLFCAVLAQELPQITKEILPEIKRMGLTGYLNCTITRQNNNKAYWIYQPTSTVLTADDEVYIEDDLNEKFNGWPKFDVERTRQGDRTTYMLIVRRLQESDSGPYTCQVVVKGADQESGDTLITIQKTGEMTVLVPPTISQAETTQTINVQEGENALLTCGATGFPKPNITWVRASGKVLPPPYNRIAYRGQKLQLKSVSGSDRGVYRCVADNAVRPPATYDATLYVAFRPYAKAVQSSYGQAQNRLFDLTIECTVSGYPQPDLRWYQVVQGGLHPISDDDRHVVHIFESHGQTLSVNEYWFQLTIINVLANDYGYYECQGTNRQGTSGARIEVYETSECQGSNCPPGDKDGSPTDINNSAVIATSCSLSLLLALLFIWVLRS